MCTRKEAVHFLQDCLATTVKVVHANESGRGMIRAVKREKEAYIQAFQAYTGDDPTPEELEQILDAR